MQLKSCLDTPSFESGKNANIVIFDPHKNGVLIKSTSLSNASNCPFDNFQFNGRVEKTFMNGHLIFDSN